MLLVFDIGNTNTVMGVYQGETLHACYRLTSDAARTVDEYTVYIKSLLRESLPGVSVKAAVISSVVPALTARFRQLLEQHFSISPLIVGPGIKTGISIQTKTPAGVGADRIVNSLAAKVKYGLPVLIVDFGTATTFDVIDESNAYRGGAIAPGLEIGLNALVERTAKLPRIDICWPDRVVGNDTIEAMQSGTVIGYACMVDGLIQKFIQEVGPLKKVIATGGLGRLFDSHCTAIDIYDEYLPLFGMYELARMNDMLPHA